jgi:hypothetical protein
VTKSVARCVLKSFLERNRATLNLVGHDYNYTCPPWRWRGDATVAVRARSVLDAVGLGRDAIALAEAFGENVSLTRDVAADLVRAGHAATLIGQPEGQWLDVKRQHYDLDATAEKIKLAQAVAKFANAEFGGLVVIGMAGMKVPGGEIVQSFVRYRLTVGRLGSTSRRSSRGSIHHQTSCRLNPSRTVISG